MGKVFKMPMRHPDIVNTKRLDEEGFVSTFPAEAAHAASEFNDDAPAPLTRWGLIKQALRR